MKQVKNTSENIDKKNIEEDNINTMIVVLKIGIIVFVYTIMYQDILNRYIAINKVKGCFNLYTMTFLLTVTGIIYLFWIIFNKALLIKITNIRILWLIETIFFTGIISLPMYFWNFYESEFKYIFLLLIITSVIQYGLDCGVWTSLISCGIVLGFDIIYNPVINGVNTYFEKDLIVSGTFIFVAWILGYYVENEKKNNKIKDMKLNKLSIELKEKDKKRFIIEEMLLKNKVCYDMLFENSQNAIIIHSHGNIIYANESAAKLLGYKNHAQLNGKSLYDYYLENNKERLINKYLNIINNKLSKYSEEETIKNSFGNKITVRNTSSYFIYESKPVLLTFLLDISSEKQIETLKKDVEENVKLLEETREYNTLVTDFFINISHELKTPINVIYIAIQTMAIYLKDYTEENMYKCKSYLKMMKQNCFRLMRLITNLLDITKLDSGFLKLNDYNDNIVEVVENITLSVVEYMKSKEIELIFDTNVEEKIMAFDHDKMERIMLNLLSNAFKYTPKGGKVNVNFEEIKENVFITIEDNGYGIPKDKINSIFERFEQVDRSLSRENEGSGIGLYLVKSFVEMHDGEINIESKEEKGTKFILKFPSRLTKKEHYEGKTCYTSGIEKINIEFSDIYSVDLDK